MYGRFSFLPSAASAVPGGFIGIKPPEKRFLCLQPELCSVRASERRIGTYRGGIRSLQFFRVYLNRIVSAPADWAVIR